MINNFLYNKKVLLIFYILFTSILIVFLFDSYSFAWGDPELVTKINSAFETI